MDKVMKAEIGDLLLKKYLWTALVTKELTNELTVLIIKWLEGKRVQGIKFHSGRQNSELSAYSPTDNQKVGRNQLITELIGELK